MRRKIVLEIIQEEINKIRQEPFYKENRAAWMTVNALIDVANKIKEHPKTKSKIAWYCKYSIEELKRQKKETNRKINGIAYFWAQPIGHDFKHTGTLYRKVTTDAALRLDGYLLVTFSPDARIEEAT